ncbi:hypothetical protein AB1Y20_004489 [Prymnesium parvum]|uniref:Uncharacterized protein n=1 Tax=Prymnesium parvum TaxID=97485 RepID=A0AB34IXP9_PRYPA
MGSTAPSSRPSLATAAQARPPTSCAAFTPHARASAPPSPRRGTPRAALLFRPAVPRRASLAAAAAEAPTGHALGPAAEPAAHARALPHRGTRHCYRIPGDLSRSPRPSLGARLAEQQGARLTKRLLQQPADDRERLDALQRGLAVPPRRRAHDAYRGGGAASARARPCIQYVASTPSKRMQDIPLARGLQHVCRDWPVCYATRPPLRDALEPQGLEPGAEEEAALTGLSSASSSSSADSALLSPSDEAGVAPEQLSELESPSKLALGVPLYAAADFTVRHSRLCCCVCATVVRVCPSC